MRVALVTCAALPELTPDDRLLLEALLRRGAQASPAVWDDGNVDWPGYDAAVIRSTWDYHLRPRPFLEWCESLDRAGVALWNPAPLIRWNAHKSYLRELEAAGAAVLPTRLLEPDARIDLEALLREEGWDDAVVKPAVSASAHRTVRMSLAQATSASPHLRELLESGDVLVQPYAPEIAEQGEWSFVFLGSQYSHAVLKRPAAGDYRVQEEWGGTTAGRTPPGALLEQARRVAGRIPCPWLYARIDGIDRQGTLVLMELELIEPHLFLAKGPEAPDRFAAAILGTGAAVPGPTCLAGGGQR